MTVHDQVEAFMSDLWRFSHTIRCRALRGQVKVMARPGATGLSGLLCVGNGCLYVLGGAELDEDIMCVPLQHVRVQLVPSRDNMFHVTVSSHDGDGIFVKVTDRSARDRWLAWLSLILSMTIDGWVSAPVEDAQRNCMTGAPCLVKWIS